MFGFAWKIGKTAAKTRNRRTHILSKHGSFYGKGRTYPLCWNISASLKKCKAGEVDLVMIHDLSRLSKDCIHLMINTEPLAQCQPEIGILSFGDQLLVMASDVADWAEKMASGDYSACRLPYFVGFTPLPPDHCEI